MAVPGGDQRDWEFARRFDIPIIEVVQGGDMDTEALCRRRPARQLGLS